MQHALHSGAADAIRGGLSMTLFKLLGNMSFAIMNAHTYGVQTGMCCT